MGTCTSVLIIIEMVVRMAGHGEELAEAVSSAILALAYETAGNADSRPVEAFSVSGKQSMPHAGKAGLL